MSEVTAYPDGIFSWVDLMSTDIEAARSFYCGLFGWEAVELPTDMGPTYTMFQIDGKNVCGGGQMPPDMAASGMPPVWTSYVNHSDVDSVVEKATAAGGTVLMAPMDVMEDGRMATIQDPTGASFGVWQPKNHIGAQVVNAHNAFSWNELQTRDPDAALAFYGALFGWDHKRDANGYYTFTLDDRMHAGMIGMDESWGEVPPNWAVYFMVEDIGASLAKVRELGGNVLVPEVKLPDLGTFSVVQDPQGGAFVLIEFIGQVDPPPTV